MQEFQQGDRVRLIATTDPYTPLRPGAQGTVLEVTTEMRERKIWVVWDSGMTLAMLPAAGDRIAKLAGPAVS